MLYLSFTFSFLFLAAEFFALPVTSGQMITKAGIAQWSMCFALHGLGNRRRLGNLLRLGLAVKVAEDAIPWFDTGYMLVTACIIDILICLYDVTFK